MIELTQFELVKGLHKELSDVIEKYEEALLLSTLIGVFEVLKAELLAEAFAAYADEEDGDSSDDDVY